MIRRTFLCVPAVLIKLLPLSRLRFRRPAPFILEDTLNATRQEVSEGYFAVGQRLQLVVRPGSIESERLAAMLAQLVRVTVEVS